MKVLTVEMPDGSKWGVPVDAIARNRAESYAHEFGGDVARSMAEDTIPLFDSDGYEVEDWAANNMDWQDVKHIAKKIRDAPDADYQDGWMNGEKSVVDVDMVTY